MSAPTEPSETTELPDVEELDVPEPETPVPETGAEIDLDTTFELLRNRRRRIVLAHLVEVGERVDMGTLAEHVAAVENDTTVQALSSAERKRAYVGLYQCHLPKLADAGVIEYNRDRGHVEAGPAAADLLAYVERDETEERDWSRLYRASTAAVAGVYLAAVGLSAVVTVPWAAVAATPLLIGVVAVAHTYHSRQEHD